MVKTLFGAVIALFIPLISQAQVPHPLRGSDQIIALARQHIQKGEACMAAGDRDCARREFDNAVDEFLQSGIDLRSDEKLLGSWRETLEKINRYETTPIVATGKQFWDLQEFEGRPPPDPVVASIADRHGPLVPDAFQSKFVDLRARFQEKYGRDLTITGADHAEHRRLYGSRSAYDIRTRDLTREQVQFIIANGRGLGLRIKDFSTWESVAAHNARTLMLGRPLDTMATGVHLHIDRMSGPKPKKLIAAPVVSAKPRKANSQTR